jgi:hypothetical protein
MADDTFSIGKAKREWFNANRAFLPDDFENAEANIETPYDRLEWGCDDGTSSSAYFAGNKYIVYSFADEWMIRTNDSAEDLVEEGEGEDSLKESVNRIALSLADLIESVIPASDLDHDAIEAMRAYENEPINTGK